MSQTEQSRPAERFHRHRHSSLTQLWEDEDGSAQGWMRFKRSRSRVQAQENTAVGTFRVKSGTS